MPVELNDKSNSITITTEDVDKHALVIMPIPNSRNTFMITSYIGDGRPARVTGQAWHGGSDAEAAQQRQKKIHAADIAMGQIATEASARGLTVGPMDTPMPGFVGKTISAGTNTEGTLRVLEELLNDNFHAEPFNPKQVTKAKVEIAK